MIDTFESGWHQTEGRSRELIDGWLAPVRHVLDLRVVEPRPQHPPTRPALRPVVARDYMATFSDPDGPWAERRQARYNLDWAAVDETDRALMADWFVQHRDPECRERAAEPLAAWGRSALLIDLLADPAFVVRKHAAYELRSIAPDPAIGRALRSYIEANPLTSTHARETIESYATHLPDEGFLARLARETERESVRLAALRELANGAALGFVDLLERPPLITNAVHVFLLDTATDAGRRLDVAERLFAQTDSVELAVAAARNLCV